jgi:hypothetical protein
MYKLLVFSDQLPVLESVPPNSHLPPGDIGFLRCDMCKGYLNSAAEDAHLLVIKVDALLEEEIDDLD